MHEIIPILGGSVQVSCQGMVTIIKRAPYVICATTPKQKGCDPSYHKHYQHLLSGSIICVLITHQQINQTQDTQQIMSTPLIV